MVLHLVEMYFTIPLVSAVYSCGLSMIIEWLRSKR